MEHALSCLVVLVLAALPLAAGPQIDNRPPKPDEVGYRPADGSTAALNPPSWIWLHEPEALTYSIQWAARKDFADAVTVEKLPLNTYTHHAPLKPGTYYWRYRFAAKDGALSNWSQARSVTVPADAVEFPMPTRAEQRQRVPKDHPRLFLRPEDLPRLRKLAGGGEAERFGKLRAAADKLLAAEPTPEPTVRASGSDPNTRKFWWPNREQTLKACREAEVLAFVYLITGEKKYGEAARKWVLHLASWDPDGPTNFSLNDEAAMPLLHRLPRAYDWAYSALGEQDRQQVRKAMLRRAQDAWKSGQIGRGVGHLNRPFNSHANRVWHKLGECAIAFLGDIPEAEDWLDYAVNKFYAIYPVWADDDGGWHEGLSYWHGYMCKIVWWLQVAKSALDIDGFRKPFFSQIGDYALYVAPPGSPNMGFGDLSHRPPSKGWGETMDYFLRAQSAQSGHAPYWRWWAERWDMKPGEDILAFLYAANLGALPAAKPPADLPQSKVFRGIGVASLHTSLLDSADDIHFLLKSSPFGSQSHGHNPQNSFQLNAYGEALLTTCVYRDWHGSPFHTKWAWSTMAHNAVLVNGEGQVKHSAAPQGKIADFRFTPKWDYVVGDATAAYGGRLVRYKRHVLFAKSGGLIVVYDDLAAAEPATFQFLLHAMKQFAVDEKQCRLSVEQPKAGATVWYLSPGPLKFRQWDGYEPKPVSQFPDQWHVEASTQEKVKELGMLTVISAYRAGQRRELSLERIESPTAIGLRVTVEGQAGRVAFRKEGVKGAATLEQSTFDDPVDVK